VSVQHTLNEVDGFSEHFLTWQATQHAPFFPVFSSVRSRTFLHEPTTHSVSDFDLARFRFEADARSVHPTESDMAEEIGAIQGVYHFKKFGV